MLIVSQDDQFPFGKKAYVKRVSPSQIESFLSCRRAWWAGKLKVPSKPTPIVYADQGKAVHAILQFACEAKKKFGIDVSRDKLLSQVSRWDLSKKFVQSSSMMIERALDLGWTEGSELCEYELSIDLKTLDPDVMATGRIDRMRRVENENAKIIDLKTGRPDNGDLLKKWQTRLYGIYGLKHSNTVEVEYWFLKDEKNPIRRVIVTADMARAWYKELKTITDEMKSFEGKQCTPNKLCTSFCGFYHRCFISSSLG